MAVESGLCMGGYPAGVKCRWVRTHFQDAYGIRNEHLRCETCGSNRVRSGPSPTTLGDHHRRED